jgi:hypothetical protein
MPSAIFKRKMPKTFGRKIRNQRRASAQASPASRSIVSDPIGDTVLPRPISSNAMIPACTDTLEAQGEAEDARGRFAHINDSRHTPDSIAKDDTQMAPHMLELPSNELLGDSNFSNTLSTIRPAPLAGKAEVPKRASLMGIPAELRIMIFKCVFPPSDPRGTTETNLYYCAPTLRVLGPSHSQLCRVNRQIYEETRGLLYGQTLVFLSREALMKFSATRTILQMSHLRNICMKPRVTDWRGAIKTLVLPPGASLTVHWPITRELWQALTANITLDYRKVSAVSGREEQFVVFEPVTTVGANRPTYEYLQRTFAVKSD